jgi:hypothetical protein
MDLIPSERAVLRQIRNLLLQASMRSHRLNELTCRWPARHYGVYLAGYVGLARKGLIAKSSDERTFSVTNAGLRAMAHA